MFIRPVFVLLLLGVFLIYESDGLFIKPKLLALKPKLIALKAKPLLIAKGLVAKEVKLKAKLAAKKTVAAAKATALAVKSAALAPLKVVKKTVGIKVAAIKAAKALKLAKLAKLAKLLKAKAAAKIIIPAGPIAVLPLKGAALKKNAAILGAGGASLLALPKKAAKGLGAGTALGLGGASALGLGAGTALGLGGASALGLGAGIPFFGGLLPRLGGIERIENTEEVTNFVTRSAYHQPDYTFAPEAGFSHYNNINFNPNIRLDVQQLPLPPPTFTVQQPPIVEHHTVIEQPHETYGVPSALSLPWP